MQRLLKLSRWIDALNDRVGSLTTLLVPLMVLLGVWNVIGRRLGKLIGQNLSSNALIEGQWYLFSLVFLLGAAYTLRHNSHVRVDVFYSQWSVRRKALVNLFGAVIFLLPFCIVVLIASWDHVIASWASSEISPDPGGLPRYPIKTAILVGFSLLGLQALSELIKNWVILQREPEQLEDRHHGI